MNRQEIWLAVSRDRYPELATDQLMALSLPAAAAWYSNDDSELANMFDQYVMLKNLHDPLDGG